MSFNSFLRLLRGRHWHGRDRSRPASRRRGAAMRLSVKALEDRIVPTVVFDPVYPKEGLASNAPFTTLNDPTVYLIFWGTGWGKGNTPGPGAVTTLTNAAQAVLASPYWNGLSEYGNVGAPSYGGAWTDSSSNPPAGYNVGGGSTSDIQARQTEIASAIQSNPSWAPSGTAITQSPIYVLIPVGANNAGYNSAGSYQNDTINMCSVGSGSSAAGTFPDQLTITFSHELAERITDPTSNGVTINYSTSSSFPGFVNATAPNVNNNSTQAGNLGYLNNGGQIGDGEQEPGGEPHYGYRLQAVLNGAITPVFVQSLWSQQTKDLSGNQGAFVVADGNSQAVYLDPVWNSSGTINLSNYGGTNTNITGPTFSGTYNLTVTGDQFGAGYNDTIVVDVTATGGTSITLNGQSFSFDPGTLARIVIDPGTGKNTIQIKNTAAGTPVYITGDGFNTVTVGNSINGMQGINAFVYAYNGYPNPSATGSTWLYLDDSADATAHTVSVYDGEIDGLSPAPIHWLDAAPGQFHGGVDNMYIYGSRADNTINVYDSSPIIYGTEIDSSSGSGHSPSVWVYATDGFLALDGGPNSQFVDVGVGNAQDIRGGIDIFNRNSYGAGTTELIVDDPQDTTAHDVTINSTSISGLTPAIVEWTDYSASAYSSGVQDLYVLGSAANNGWTVNSDNSYAGATTTLYTGIGTGHSEFVSVLSTTSPLTLDGRGETQVVYIGDFNGSAQSIDGSVSIVNTGSYGSGSSIVNLIDDGDHSARSVSMYDGQITGFAPAPISWNDYNPDPNSYDSGVLQLLVFGSAADNSWTVYGDDAYAGAHTYLYPASGSGHISSVDIEATTSPLTLDGQSSAQEVFIADISGNMQGIQGSVDVINSNSQGQGYSNLDLFDEADGSDRTASMQDGAIVGLAPAPILWDDYNPNAGSLYSGVIDLQIFGGSGFNTWTVTGDNSYTGAYTRLDSGTADSSVSVQATTTILDVGGGAGTQTVVIGSTAPALGGTLQSILGTVDVFNVDSSGQTLLTIDDSGDTAATAPNLYDGQLTGLSPAPITWFDYEPSLPQGGVSSLTIFGGSGGNTWNVYSNGPSSADSTYLTTSSAASPVNSNVVYVYATTSPLTVDGGSDFQEVALGQGGDVQSILGSVNVTNSGASGFSYLSVSDLNDTTGQSPTLSDGSLTGLAPAPITWAPSDGSTGGVWYLSVEGGSGDNTFTVQDTSLLVFGTSLYPGSGTSNNTVNIHATSGALTVFGEGSTDAVMVGNQAPSLGGTLTGIQGDLSILNDFGSVSLVLDDSGDTAARTATLDGSTLSGLGNSATITYSVSALTIDGAKGGSVYNIQADSVPTTINGGSGTDTFNLGSSGDASGSLAGLVSDLTVNGASNTDALHLFDQGNGASQVYTFSPNAISLNGIVSVNYATMESVSLDTAGAGGNLVFITANATIATSITGNGGDNTLVGPNLTDTWTINHADGGTMAGKVTFADMQNLEGGSGNDTFKISTANGSVSGNIDGGGGATNTLDYSGDGGRAATVDLATGTGSFVASFSGLSKLVGSAAADTLIGPDTANTWSVSGNNAGKVGAFSYSAVENLVGGSDVDWFKLAAAGKEVSIDGGGGSDWLDYSAFTAGVTVDLVTGSASNINGGAAGSVSNLPNVRGGKGDDHLTGNGGNILIGNGGNDVLVDAFTGSDASGRSLLIGGAGSDTLTAGSAGDILISGTTSYDAKNANLAAILAEWQSGDDYNTRFNRLHAGTNKLVWLSTVKDDGAADVLNGGAGLDWYFAQLTSGTLDTINGLNVPAHEHLDNAI